MARKPAAPQFAVGDIVRIPITFRHGVKTRYSGELMEVTHVGAYGTYTMRLVGGTPMDTMGSTGGPDFIIETRSPQTR